MILFLRSNGINPDPRLQKYIDFCIKNDLNYHVLAWDRLNEGLESDSNITYFKKSSSFGGGLSNALNLIFWNFFLLINIFLLRKKITVIHSCDLDTGVIAYFYKLFKIKFIYDIFDWYGDSRGGKLRYIFNVIECHIVKSADHTIICDEGRIKQIGFIPTKYSILPNIPTYDDISKNYDALKDGNYEKINITYVGILTTDRHLDLLIELSKKIDENNCPVILTVAGFGVLSDTFTDVCMKKCCLEFKGKVNYTEAQKIISNSDLMFAFYDINVINNIYAAPNKFFESLALSTPLITNPGTLLSDKLSNNNCGYIVLPNIDELYDFIINLNIDDIKNKKRTCERMWETKYKDYNDNYFTDIYRKLVTE